MLIEVYTPTIGAAFVTVLMVPAEKSQYAKLSSLAAALSLVLLHGQDTALILRIFFKELWHIQAYWNKWDNNRLI